MRLTVIIPYTQLSESALAGVIEEFVTREGTDYGQLDITFDQKCQQVRQQLINGSVVIVFDSALESINLIAADELQDPE